MGESITAVNWEGQPLHLDCLCLLCSPWGERTPAPLPLHMRCQLVVRLCERASALQRRSPTLIYIPHIRPPLIYSPLQKKENMSHIITRSRMTNWATWSCSKPPRHQVSLILFFMTPHFSFLSTSQPAWLIISPFPVWMSRIEVLNLKQIYAHYR